MWAFGDMEVINETVLAVKEYLDAELAKCEKLECADNSIRALFKGKKGDFQHCKASGVGRETILKFLGGNGKQGRIYNRTKKAHGGDRKSSDQIDHLKTAEKMDKNKGAATPKPGT